MRILVCVKQVPDIESILEIDTAGMWIQETGKVVYRMNRRSVEGKACAVIQCTGVVNSDSIAMFYLYHRSLSAPKTGYPAGTGLCDAADELTRKARDGHHSHVPVSPIVVTRGSAQGAPTQRSGGYRLTLV